jgi:hypothetical protein
MNEMAFDERARARGARLRDGMVPLDEGVTR